MHSIQTFIYSFIYYYFEIVVFFAYSPHLHMQATSKQKRTQIPTTIPAMANDGTGCANVFTEI
jgi:hypothetical protein